MRKKADKHSVGCQDTRWQGPSNYTVRWHSAKITFPQRTTQVRKNQSEPDKNVLPALHMGDLSLGFYLFIDFYPVLIWDNIRLLIKTYHTQDHIKTQVRESALWPLEHTIPVPWKVHGCLFLLMVGAWSELAFAINSYKKHGWVIDSKTRPPPPGLPPVFLRKWVVSSPVKGNQAGGAPQGWIWFWIQKLPSG